MTCSRRAMLVVSASLGEQMAKRDKSREHLRWLGRQWGLRIRYPKPLTNELGQDWDTAKTNTADLKEAQLLRDQMISALERKAREIEKKQQPSIDRRELALRSSLPLSVFDFLKGMTIKVATRTE